MRPKSTPANSQVHQVAGQHSRVYTYNYEIPIVERESQ